MNEDVVKRSDFFHDLFKKVVKFIKLPSKLPNPKPKRISIGPCNADWRSALFSSTIAKPMHIVKPVIATISSKLAEAMIKEGIPFSTPNPSCCSFNIPLTTTAGLTAARINPREMLNQKGIPKINIPQSAVTIASKHPGINVRRKVR